MRKLCLIAWISCLMMNSYSQTNKNIIINVDTTWKEKDSPFYITGEVLINTNATLTIEQGSLVIFEDIKSRIEVRGKLNSNGVTFKTYYSPKNNHRDSLIFQNKYYTPADYKKVKEAYDKVNYETWFMPGLSYTYFQPKITDSIGLFSGVTVEYLIYAKVGQNDHPGPSHVRVYSKFNILKSNKSDINSMFMYTLGLDLSLEKNPKRSFLVPYFGLEIGGMSQRQFGTTFQFTPTFGMHLLSKKNIYINISGGYVYPLSNFEMLQGWFGQAGLNFALW